VSVVAAAVVPSPPLLIRELTGRSVALPELREACAVAVSRLVTSPAADLVAVVGAGSAPATWDPDSRLDVAAFGPLPGARRGNGKSRLPLALGIGARLLDDAGYAGPLVLQSVGSAASAAECVAAGAAVAGLAPRVALLIVGDGSARRSLTAPGYLDERAEPFDARTENAIREGDMAALAGLDVALAAELMAAGRAAWQVLAGAVGLERRAPGEVLYADAPLGVCYLAAVLDVPGVA
jgi:hypothetical protein